MPPLIPADWFYDAPKMLTIGNGAYAAALVQVLGTARMDSADFCSDFPPDVGGNPLVLSDLKQVFIVAASQQSAFAVLGIYETLWRWVQRFTKTKEEHTLAVLFILPACEDTDFERLLAIRTAATPFDPETAGYGIAHMADGLLPLLETAGRICARDFKSLKARRTADERHAALAALAESVERGDGPLTAAAGRIRRAFFEAEHLLDAFCQSPCHPNGHRLRTIIETLMTAAVSPASLRTIQSDLRTILRFPP